MKQWIFDNRDGTKRLLRFRAGHSAPPTQVTFYGEGGKRLLSAGGDRALRVFSAIQDQQSRELSQSHVERRATETQARGTGAEAPGDLRDRVGGNQRTRLGEHRYMPRGRTEGVHVAARRRDPRRARVDAAGEDRRERRRGKRANQSARSR